MFPATKTQGKMTIAARSQRTREMNLGRTSMTASNISIQTSQRATNNSSIMAMIEELLVALWDVWMEMFEAVMEVLPKFISLVLWLLAAIVILPCVFVAGNIFPYWVEWGEDL